jgi:hypothetical protein
VSAAENPLQLLAAPTQQMAAAAASPGYSAGARPYSSTQVVSRFLSVLRQQIQQDWVRTSGDIRIDSGVPMSWLRGKKKKKVLAAWPQPGPVDFFFFFFFFFGVSWLQERNQATQCHPSKGPTRERCNLTDTTPRGAAQLRHPYPPGQKAGSCITPYQALNHCIGVGCSRGRV